MLWAQRARDAAMALTLAGQWRRRRAGGDRGPVILLAGNGHVRRDYGVPQLLAAMLPQARLLAVCLLEPGHDAPPCDVIWTTAATSRDDPCRGFGGVPRAS